MGALARRSAYFNNNKNPKKCSRIPELGPPLEQSSIETGKDDEDDNEDEDGDNNEILTVMIIMGVMRIMRL